MGFPKQVNVQPAVAVEGDFASANPRFTVPAGPGGFVAGPNGVAVGRFAWADATNTVAANTGAGAPTGFVHREQNGLITAFLGDDTMLVPAGLGVTLFSGGDFWVKNAGTLASAIGQKAYANNADGSVTFGATSTPTTGGTSSAASIAVNLTTSSSTLALNSFTASIAGTTMTVTAAVAGTVLGKGQTLSGGSSVVGYVDPATTIVAQLTGTAGSTGTYQVSVSQTILSTNTFAASGGGLTIGTVTSGTFYVGQVISGTGIVSGTKIIGFGTSTGGAGTAYIDKAPTAGASIAVTGAGGTLTIGGTVTGSYKVGDQITGSTITSGSTIVADASAGGGLTGVGGAGTYIVSAAQTVTSQEIDAYSNTETKWIATSVGAPGELVKMSSHLLG